MTLACTASLHTASIGETVPNESIVGLTPATASGLKADPVSGSSADPDAAWAAQATGFLGLFELFAGAENGTSALPDDGESSVPRPQVRVPEKDPHDTDSSALAAWAGLVQTPVVIPLASETPSPSTPEPATATGLPGLGAVSRDGGGQFADAAAEDAETACSGAPPTAELPGTSSFETLQELEIADDTGPATESLAPGMPLAEPDGTEDDAEPVVQSTPALGTDIFTPDAGIPEPQGRPLQKNRDSRGSPEVSTDEIGAPAGSAASQTGPVEAAAESVLSPHKPQVKAVERTSAAAKGQSTAPGGGDERIDSEPPAFENRNAGPDRAAPAGELAFEMHMRPKSPEDAASQPLNGSDALPAIRTVPEPKPGAETRAGGPPLAPGAGADSTPPPGKASDASAESAEPSPPQPQRTSSGDSGTPHREPSGKQRQSTEPSSPSSEPAGNWGPATEVRTTGNGSDKTEKASEPASDSARPVADAGHPAENRAEGQRPTAPARDIRLVLNGGERPVQVRVVERAGELHVDVRTPDARLAGNLREQLPELTARLDDNGFRAQAWHPQSDSADRLRTLETRSPAGEDGRESNPKGGGRDAQDAPPKPRIPEEERRPKQDRNAFAGLMQSTV